MFAFLIVILFGILFSFFATQNTQGISVQFFQYSWNNVPLYLVALFSLLAGVTVSWLISLMDWASNTLTLHGKDLHIRKTEKVIENLQQRINELERKNTELHQEKEIIREDVKEEIADVKEHIPQRSILDRFRQKPAL